MRTPGKNQRGLGFNPGLSAQQQGDKKKCQRGAGCSTHTVGMGGERFYPPGTPPGTIERVTDTGGIHDNEMI